MNSIKPEREGRERLRTVELLVADEQRHDLHRHRRDGLEADSL